jgi:hypothetical protein
VVPWKGREVRGGVAGGRGGRRGGEESAMLEEGRGEEIRRWQRRGEGIVANWRGWRGRGGEQRRGRGAGAAARAIEREEGERG